MKRINRILLIVVVLVIVLVYFSFHPVVINMPKGDGKAVAHTYHKGEAINPFKDYAIDNENFTAYIIINERVDLASDMPYGGILKTNDINLLKQLRDNLAFEYTEADVATVENEFLLFDGDKLVFRAGIVLDENSQGLQNSNLGWIRAKGRPHMLSSYCSQFTVCFPLLIFY